MIYFFIPVVPYKFNFNMLHRIFTEIYGCTPEVCKLKVIIKGIRESWNQVSVRISLLFNASKSRMHYLIIYFYKQISQYEITFAMEEFNHRASIIWQLLNYVSNIKILKDLFITMIQNCTTTLVDEKSTFYHIYHFGAKLQLVSICWKSANKIYNLRLCL